MDPNQDLVRLARPAPDRGRRLWLLLGGVWLSGCAAIGQPRAITLSQAELQARLAREFPIERRLVELLDVTVGVPALRLLPERNRIGAEFELQVHERLFGSRRRGRIGFDSALRIEPADASLRLSKVAIQSLQLEAGTLPASEPVHRLAALLAERVLEDLVLWRARPEQLERLRLAGLERAAVTVTAHGIELRVAPTA